MSASLRRRHAPSWVVLTCLALGGPAIPAGRAAAAAAAPDEIHWTILGPDSVAIAWRGGGNSVSVWPEQQPAAATSVTAAARPGRHRSAIVRGLSPDRAYRYRIAGAPAQENHLLRTPPADCGAPFSFAVEGDIGAANRSPAAPAVQALIARARPRFVLALGDLAYADGNEATVNRHFDDVMIWSADAAYMPTWGNHDWMYGRGDDLAMYKARFELPHAQSSPDAPAAGCCDKDWSWFDYGCLRVITYPEPYQPATWRDWAERAEPIFRAAQADPRIRFIVTAGHRPAFTSGGHHGEGRLRKILNGFARTFDKYVLNLAGHNHDYERTKRMHGVVHVTVGTGGARLERQPTPCGWPECETPSRTRFRAYHHGALIVTVAADRITGKFVCGPPSAQDDVSCAEGAVLDELVIEARKSD